MEIRAKEFYNIGGSQDCQPDLSAAGFGQNVLLVEDGDGFRGLADSEIQSMHRFFIFAGLTII